jgi:hypothetical protein
MHDHAVAPTIGTVTQPGEDPRQVATSTGEGAQEPVLKLRAEAVDWRKVEGQVVALDRAGSVYLAINEAGTELWPAIVEGTTRKQLVRILLDTFDVQPDSASADVDSFVSYLSERSLLEPSS